MRLSSGCMVMTLAFGWALIGSGWMVPSAGAQDTASGSAAASPSQEKKPTLKKHPQSQPTQTRPASNPRTQTSPAAQTQGNHKGAPLTFTDEDLKKYHPAGSTQPARNVAPAPTADPLKAFKDQEAKASWRKARAGELQQKVLDLEAKLKALQQRRLSILNPLLPRVPDPEEGSQSETGLSGPELLARTDEEIKHTNLLLESAKKDLATFVEQNPE